VSAAVWQHPQPVLAQDPERLPPAHRSAAQFIGSSRWREAEYYLSNTLLLPESFYTSANCCPVKIIGGGERAPAFGNIFRAFSRQIPRSDHLCTGTPRP
jgi:hypothetical protein